MAFPEPLERLINALEKFPGVGARSAERMALHVLRSTPDDVASLAMALRELRRRVDSQEITEVVLATAPDREGEGAALKVIEALDGADVIITRLARGLPVGARLEYLHGDILADAYDGRRKLDS